MNENTIYSRAKLYDVLFGEPLSSSQFKFYFDLINEYGQPVLAMACGTGRITLPLGQAGIKIVGLDISKDMIALARNKDSAGVVDYRVGDMRDFSLNQKFDFAFVPSQSFQHLLTNQDVSGFFDSVHQHLTDKGALLIQIFMPNLDILTRSSEQFYPTSRDFYLNNHTGEKYMAKIKSSYDPITQILRSSYHYHVEGESSTREFTLSMRQFFPQEIDGLIESHGFKLINKYGDHLGTPFGQKPAYQNILIGKKSS